VLLADRADLVERLVGRGRRVSVRDSEQRGLVQGDRGLNVAGGEHCAPLTLDDANVGLASLGNLAQKMAEATEDRDEHDITGLDQADEGRLDAGPGRAIHQHVGLVCGGEHAAV
jgi:hypothetical protein